jgi:hypothetical protein
VSAIQIGAVLCMFGLAGRTFYDSNRIVSFLESDDVWFAQTSLPRHSALKARSLIKLFLLS